jgi:hypothetical protein
MQAEQWLMELTPEGMGSLEAAHFDCDAEALL